MIKKLFQKILLKFGKSVTVENNCIIDGYAKQKIVLGNSVKIISYSTLTIISHFSKYGIGLKMENNSAVGNFTHLGAVVKDIFLDNVIIGSIPASIIKPIYND